jgi:D-alanyl-D-alanine carboxypeptidase/D-alanyl-D-alanine-endopeptidase (penicillin-binding protein 4)
MESFIKSFACFLSVALLIGAPEASALDPTSAVSVFSQVANAATLKDPSVALVDASTGEFIFEANSNSPRKPASVLKILSAVAAIKYLDSEQRFETKVLSSSEEKSVVLIGELDPWFSLRTIEAQKMHRTSVPTLATKIQSTVGKNRHRFTVYYSNLYPTDVANLNKYFKKKRRTIAFKKVTEEEAIARSIEEVFVSSSPTIKEITTWFLTWSDNVLAERMARFAARAGGYAFNDYGVSDIFKTILTDMEIDSSVLNIHDASGLSKENRITAHLMGQLLYKIHQDSAFSSLIDGLPVSGKSGTLSSRYLDTAPEAVGLVKAKTGTLNGTVSLAGYVESGDREYIFVVIADKLARGSRASHRARATLDSLLGSIASPLTETSTAISGSQTL